MTFKERFQLTGKNIIVTGAAGILGSRICEGIAELGGNAILFDKDEAKALELSNKLNEKYSVKCSAYSCDVTDSRSVATAFNEAVKKYQTIHVLHNNAAYRSPTMEEYFESFENYSLSEWRRVMEVNIDGMFLMAQIVGKHMIENKVQGSIIQTCSVYGVVAPDQRIYEGSEYKGRKIGSPAVYSASKAAVHGLTQYLASYWGKNNIRVNSVTPGGVESGQNEAFKQKYSARVPMGRMAEADEIASAVLFLASGGSTYITGQNIIADGGLTAW